jgi:hypothetical protein
MESIISIKELCEALGVEYDRSKSSAYYLHMVKEYRLHYAAAQDVCPECGEPFDFCAMGHYDVAKARRG